jgi:hypothetical protein
MNRCSQPFRDLLEDSLKRSVCDPLAGGVWSQLLEMFDGLLHEDPWERYECFQIEEMLQQTILLIRCSGEG